MKENCTVTGDFSEIHVIFVDIDNTLLDFDAYVRQTMETGFEKFGLRTYEPWMYDEFRRINNGLWHQIELGTLTFEELQKIRWNCIFAEIGIAFDGPTFETYFRKSLFTNAVLMEGAMEMMRYLSERYVVCAASNGPYDQQVNRLKISGLLPLMMDVYASEDIGASKPDPAFYREAMTRLSRKLGRRVKSSEILMLGDSLTSDMDGGIAAGLRTCWYAGGRKAADPGDRKLDAVITDLRALSEIL